MYCMYTHVETKRYNSCSEKLKPLLSVLLKKSWNFNTESWNLNTVELKWFTGTIFITLKVLLLFLIDLSLTFLSLGPAQNTSPHLFSGLGFLIHLMHPLLPVLLWKFHTPLMHNPSTKLWKKVFYSQIPIVNAPTSLLWMPPPYKFYSIKKCTNDNAKLIKKH